MPLRDHFSASGEQKIVVGRGSAAWPTCVVQHLRNLLPGRFRCGAARSPGNPHGDRRRGGRNRTRCAASQGVERKWQRCHCGRRLDCHSSGVAVETEPPDEYEYESAFSTSELERLFGRGHRVRQPANKDRPESRDSFVAKCAQLASQGRRRPHRRPASRFGGSICMRRIDDVHPASDPVMTADEPAIYAAPAVG